MRSFALFAACTLALFVFTLPAFSLELSQAKAQGLVGEQPNGYLGVVVNSPSTEVQALVSEINAKRKEKYQEISNTRKAPLKSVEKLAGKEALERTPSGQYVRTPAGAWVKK